MIADAPKKTPYDQIVVELTARCLEREGDPRTWPESTPNDQDFGGMQESYSYCTWVLEHDELGIRAISRWHPAPEHPTLPFRPSFVPLHEIAGTGDVIRVESPPMRVRAVVEFEQGYLVGYNSGEWGGGLYWYTHEGELQQRISNENVVRIAALERGFLVFTGIAHMMTNEGAATFIEFDGTWWNIVHSLDLAGAPRVFVDEPEGSFVVATADRILRVINGRRVEILHRSRWGFWGPNSIAKDADGTLYLGSLYVVTRLRPLAVGYAETWLAPPGATRPRPVEGH